MLIGLRGELSITFIFTYRYDRLFASLLGPGSISLLFYADRLARTIPMLVATSFFTLFLPELSEARARRQGFKEVRKAMAVFLMSLGIPLALLIFWSGEDIVDILLVHGRFKPELAPALSGALELFSLGIPAIVTGAALRNLFIVERNLRAVLLFGLLTVALTAVSDGLLFRFGIKGIALASSLTSWVVFVYLWIYTRMGRPGLAQYRRLILATAIMAGLLFLFPQITE